MFIEQRDAENTLRRDWIERFVAFLHFFSQKKHKSFQIIDRIKKKENSSEILTNVKPARMKRLKEGKIKRTRPI